MSTIGTTQTSNTNESHHYGTSSDSIWMRIGGQGSIGSESQSVTESSTKGSRPAEIHFDMLALLKEKKQAVTESKLLNTDQSITSKLVQPPVEPSPVETKPDMFGLPSGMIGSNFVPKPKSIPLVASNNLRTEALIPDASQTFQPDQKSTVSVTQQTNQPTSDIALLSNPNPATNPDHKISGASKIQAAAKSSKKFLKLITGRVVEVDPKAANTAQQKILEFRSSDKAA